MMRSFLWYSTFVSLLSFICGGCSSGEPNRPEAPAEISTEAIEGHWELVSAHRDGKTTRVLDNTYFEFSKDSMQTNLPSKEGRYPYRTIKNEIVSEEASSSTFYRVQFFSVDTMVFSVKLRDYLFEMTLAMQKYTDKETEDL